MRNFKITIKRQFFVPVHTYLGNSVGLETIKISFSSRHEDLGFHPFSITQHRSLTLYFQVFPFGPLGNIQNLRFYDVLRGIEGELWEENSLKILRSVLFLCSSLLKPVTNLS